MVRWQNSAGEGGVYIEGDGFAISYQPVENLVAGGHPDGETALIEERDGKRGACLILNGDWRSQYEPLIEQGYDACKAFYDKMAPQHRSKWSEDDAYEPTAEETIEVLIAAFAHKV